MPAFDVRLKGIKGLPPEIARQLDKPWAWAGLVIGHAGAEMRCVCDRCRHREMCDWTAEKDGTKLLEVKRAIVVTLKRYEFIEPVSGRRTTFCFGECKECGLAHYAGERGGEEA